MLFERVLEDVDLFAIKRNSIVENGVEVEIHRDLFARGDGADLDHERICILKLDDYRAYNSRHTHNPPKVIDNFVAVRCCDGSVSIYLIELRSSQGRRPTQRLKASEIEEKFCTAAHDFIGARYLDVFAGMKIKEIKAYLVSNPWGLGSSGGDEIFEKKIKLSSLDVYSSRKPIEVLNHRFLINPVLPPNPVVSPC